MNAITPIEFGTTRSPPSTAFVSDSHKYLKSGLSPLAIVPETKRPGINGWQQYGYKQPTDEDLERWIKAYPHAGLGIALGTPLAGGFHLVAFDIDQERYSQAVKKIVFGQPENAEAIFIAKRGKRGITFFARSSQALSGAKFQDRSGMAVEILSRGQQTVLPPTIHPETGQPYQWISPQPLLSADLSRLPVVGPETIAAIRLAVSSPIGGAQGEPGIRYLGNGKFGGVAIFYPGNVNSTGWKMAGAAARYNHRNGPLTESSRSEAIEAICEIQHDAYVRSGSDVAWDFEKQHVEVASQYDRQLQKLGPTEVLHSSQVRTTLEIIRPADFTPGSIPPREWLVDGWIPHRQVVGLYGDGGIGKSLVSLQLMAACALGQPWFGLKTIPCSTFGFFCEDDKDELLRRTDAIVSSYGAKLSDLENRMLFASRVGEDNFLMTFPAQGNGQVTTLAELIGEYLQKARPGLTVIDTAADTFGGNEIIRAQVRQFIAQALGGLARSSNGTVLVCAHPSRAGLQEGSGSGGSTAWNNSFRARLYLQRPNPQSNERVLSRKKSNYGPIEGETIPLDWEDGAFVRLDGSGAEALKTRIHAKESFLAALDALGDQHLSTSVVSSAFAPRVLANRVEVNKLPVAQLATAMDDLLREGVLEVVETGTHSKPRKSLRRVQPVEFPPAESIEEEFSVSPRYGETERTSPETL